MRIQWLNANEKCHKRLVCGIFVRWSVHVVRQRRRRTDRTSYDVDSEVRVDCGQSAVVALMSSPACGDEIVWTVRSLARRRRPAPVSWRPARGQADQSPAIYRQRASAELATTTTSAQRHTIPRRPRLRRRACDDRLPSSDKRLAGVYPGGAAPSSVDPDAQPFVKRRTPAR